MMCTMFSGIVQFSFVLVSVTLVNVVVVLTDLEDDPVGKKIIQGTQVLKIVSTTVAMYQIFMLHETMEENNGLRSDYNNMKPELKFLFFKIPILATMWLEAGVKLLKDSNQAALLQNLVISLIMFLFAILSVWAFPPSELTDFPNPEHVDDPRPAHSCNYTLRMLMDIWHLKQRAKKRRACMEALVRFHEDCMLLDIDKDGVLERDEFMYLCEVAGVADDRGAHGALWESARGQIRLKNIFPTKFAHPATTPSRTATTPSAPLLSYGS